MMEIERKWLIDAFPDLPLEEECAMEQGYLAFEPATVRIRRAAREAGDEFWLTVKGGGTLSRAEVEVALTAEQYGALKALLAAPPATKRHRTYRLPGGQTLECSLVDEGQPCAFFYAEVEFGSEEEARAFQPPAFLGREVTEEGEWSMAAHCRRKGARQNSVAFSAALLERQEL